MHSSRLLRGRYRREAALMDGGLQSFLHVDHTNASGG